MLSKHLKNQTNTHSNANVFTRDLHALLTAEEEQIRKIAKGDKKRGSYDYCYLDW